MGIMGPGYTVGSTFNFQRIESAYHRLTDEPFHIGHGTHDHPDWTRILGRRKQGKGLVN